MSISIKEDSENPGKADEISLALVNRKLESFVEILVSKLTAQQEEMKKLKDRVKELENDVAARRKTKA